MTLQEYKDYYDGLIIGVINPAVKREANIGTNLMPNPDHQADLENKKNGLIILSLVSVLDSNFLSGDLTKLRKFEGPQPSVPTSVDADQLSCFIYLRDCFAHNPNAVLLSSGPNTTGFTEKVNDGSFKWANISGDSITIKPDGIHELHLIALEFFKESE